MHKVKLFLPFLLLFLLLFVLAEQLFFSKKNELPSALVGEEIPAFALPSLVPSGKILTNQTLLGRAILLNVWASWCTACALEQHMLMKIRDDYHIPIYGLNYKDNPSDAKLWLQKNGNPYVLIGNDAKGDVAIDFGVYGTPETFVISPQGRIIYRQVGPINEKNWQETLYPLLKKYERQS